MAIPKQLLRILFLGSFFCLPTYAADIDITLDEEANEVLLSTEASSLRSCLTGETLEGVCHGSLDGDYLSTGACSGRRWTCKQNLGFSDGGRESGSR